MLSLIDPNIKKTMTCDVGNPQKCGLVKWDSNPDHSYTPFDK
jgi:hypothetical protein